MSSLLIKQVALLLLRHLQTFLDLAQHVLLLPLRIVFVILFTFTIGQKLCKYSVPRRIDLVLNVPSGRLICIKDDSSAKFLLRIIRTDDAW